MILLRIVFHGTHLEMRLKEFLSQVPNLKCKYRDRCIVSCQQEMFFVKLWGADPALNLPIRPIKCYLRDSSWRLEWGKRLRRAWDNWWRGLLEQHYCHYRTAIFIITYYWPSITLSRCASLTNVASAFAR